MARASTALAATSRLQGLTVRRRAQEAWLGEVMAIVCYVQLLAAAALLAPERPPAPPSTEGAGAAAASERPLPLAAVAPAGPRAHPTGLPGAPRRAAGAAAAPAPAAGEPSGASAAGQRGAAVAAFLDDAAGAALAAVQWGRDVVAAALPGLPPARFRALLLRVLFLEPGPGAYFSAGEAFGAAEAAALALLAGSVPAGEDLLTHVVLLGLTPTPLAPADALEVVEALLRRTAAQAAAAGGRGPPAGAAVGNAQLPGAVLQLALYQAPAAPAPPQPGLPDPPGLARCADWWAALRCGVLLAALHPGRLAAALAADVPAAAAMLDMLVTASRSWPPGDDAAAATAAADAAAAEATADATAAAEVARFLGACGAAWEPPPGGVVRLAPGAAPRALPAGVVDELFAMDALYGLGAALRACRAPDLLAAAAGRQRLAAAWPWAARVLRADPAALPHLQRAWRAPLLLRACAAGGAGFPGALRAALGALLARELLPEGAARAAGALDGPAAAAAGLLARCLASTCGPLRRSGRPRTAAPGQGR